MTPALKLKLFLPAMLLLAAAGIYFWTKAQSSGPGAGFVSGNGRVEATEIAIATKLAGRVENILVSEGDFVQAGQPLAEMQTDVLEAQRDEALAQSRNASNSVSSAKAQVTVRESEKAAAEALLAQRESELELAQRTLKRAEALSKADVNSAQEFDDAVTRARSAEAALAAARAQVAASQAAIEAARAQVSGAESSVLMSLATISRIEADIADSRLKAPRDGRVEYRIAEPGEVLAGGGKVLNLIDLNDVYMTFFLPEKVAGKVALGSEVRVVLDAAPQYVIPAKVSYVASVAQFTPKTVETASEREKLMFRVKAHFPRELLNKHLEVVKTGIPGVAWLKLDAQVQWPESLAVKVPE
jgi:HlyD family secretion protein